MGYVGFIVLFAVIGVLVWWLAPDLRRGRKYKAELRARSPVSDDELFEKHFAKGEVAPDIPKLVRRTFARDMQLPAEKMLPDDDLMFFWADLDMVELVLEFEREFGIVITDSDAEYVHSLTIRTVSRLIERKRGQKRSA